VSDQLNGARLPLSYPIIARVMRPFAIYFDHMSPREVLLLRGPRFPPTGWYSLKGHGFADGALLFRCAHSTQLQNASAIAMPIIAEARTRRNQHFFSTLLVISPPFPGAQCCYYAHPRI
jgi:hypothetical protein